MLKKFPQCKNRRFLDEDYNRVAVEEREIYERSNNRTELCQVSKGANKNKNCKSSEVLDAAGLGFKCVTSYDVTFAHDQRPTPSTDSHHLQIQNLEILDPPMLMLIGFTVNYAQR